MNGDEYRQALVEGERIGQTWTLLPPRGMQLRAGGTRVGRRAGGSLEFRDYRDYHPGDDLRHLDWSVFARSDKLTVRQFQEEASPVVELVVDASRSMALPLSRKPHVALGLAAMLVAAARNSGFPATLFYARESLARPADAASRPSAWSAPRFEYGGSPADAVLRAPAVLRPLGMRFLISDLLWPVDPSPVVNALAAGAAALVIIEVLAAADARPELDGDLRLRDVESDELQDIVVDGAAAELYRAALQRHRAVWDDAARDAGATILRCVADDLGDALVFDELAAADILRPQWLSS